MNSDELARELDLPGSREMLQLPLLRLAYDDDDGPRVIPFGFLWKGGRIVVGTSTIAPKVKALQTRPRVAITLDEGVTSATARSLLLRGDAEIEVVEGVPDEYLEAAAKTLTAVELEGFRAGVSAVYDRMARISITPDWARFYDFGAGRLPATLQRVIDAGVARG
jgi:hypothetical protein